MQGSRAILLATLACAVVLTLVFAQQALAAQEGSVPKTFDFGNYLQKFRKAYDKSEAVNRAKLFYARTLNIFKTNYLYATQKIDYYVHQNQFTDLSPEEIKRQLAYPGGDLKPVEEARLSPETPADQFVLDEQGTPSVFEPMTRGSSEPAPEASPRGEPAMDFFSSAPAGGDELDIKRLLGELQHDQTLAKDMSRVIDMRDKRHASEEEEKYELERARKENNVVYKPYVASTNKQFDPSMIQTQSWVEDAELFSKRYANFMMDDLMADLEPYPEPVAPRARVLNGGKTDSVSSEPQAEISDTSAGYLSGFMDSVKELKDYFTWDFTDTDGFDELDEDEAKRAIDAEQHNNAAAPEPRKGEIRYDVDWRQTGCLSAVKSQGQCNSCATFASLDLLEFLYCRQMKTSTEFSPQFLMDCGHKTGLRGCEGGKLSNVGMFIKKNGLQLNSVYPYQARQNECPFAEEDQEKSYMLKPEITGWRLFPQISAWYKWIPKSPIIVGINMPGDFLGYSGGIHDGLNCVPDMVHAMLLVGSGKEDGKPFWLLKNSFADTWGEAGYFRLSKKAPIKCFNAAVVALAKFQAQESS